MHQALKLVLLYLAVLPSFSLAADNLNQDHSPDRLPEVRGTNLLNVDNPYDIFQDDILNGAKVHRIGDYYVCGWRMYPVFPSQDDKSMERATINEGLLEIIDLTLTLLERDHLKSYPINDNKS